MNIISDMEAIMDFKKIVQKFTGKISIKEESTFKRNSNKQVTINEEKKMALKRKVAILLESTELVNNSNNLDTVFHRYDMVCNLLNELSVYTKDDFKAADCNLKAPLQETQNFMQNNKNTIINQAIERNLRHEIDMLHSPIGKLKKLDVLFKYIKNKERLNEENISFLNKLYIQLKSDLESISKTPDNITINFSHSIIQNAKVQPKTNFHNYDLNTEYVELSTSGDENVCPMCAQFEGKIFPSSDAPKLPLCPSCACAYLYYFKDDLPSNAKISTKDDFILPAKCTPLFYKHQKILYTETDIDKRIRLCESDLKKLTEFMAPYLSANFPAPAELACRDLLPDLYMQLGKWDKAEKAINTCIAAKAYFPDDGLDELAYLASYRKVATETISYIQKNQGCLQRNIYKVMQYEGTERDQLKYFLRYSKQIRKVKHGNTNELYYD